MALLEVKDLTFTYPERTRPAVRNISFRVERGAFVTVCGPTGSGKSTLIRLLKRELRPLGQMNGEILFDSVPADAMDARESARAVGYVMQRPEQQLVTDKVWHELAFGLENLGVESGAIRRRVAEIAQYFGIEDWFERDVASLSGGQKQLLNLAAVMVMQPDILLLDEPTAQLDPIAADHFINTVHKLNRDLALTVIIIEHRLEEVIPLSDQMLVLEDGALRDGGDVRACVARLKDDPVMLPYLPAAVRVFSRLDTGGACPLTVREGRALIETRFKNEIRALPLPEYTHSAAPALEFQDVRFRYERESPDVLRGLTLTVWEGELFCVLGGNGSGKSTALAAASALIRPYAGQIRVFGRPVRQYREKSLYRMCLALLPQDVQTVFMRNTLKEELKDVDLSGFPYDLSPLMDSHPYDLSGGQQQLAALAKVLAAKPRLLLLDEPTKGLDANSKRVFIGVLRRLKAQGVTIVCVTHDAEFAAAAADRCALFFRGDVVSADVPRVFFSGSGFYTTAASHMTRGYYDRVATAEDAADILAANGGHAL